MNGFLLDITDWLCIDFSWTRFLFGVEAGKIIVAPYNHWLEISIGPIIIAIGEQPIELPRTIE